MTSALSLPLLSRHRHPSWYLLLWLPLLPLVSHQLTPWMAEPWEVRSPDLSGSALLAVLGAGLAFGLPGLLERLGLRMRKEAELLRGPWLASLYLVQAGVLFFGRSEALDVMLMVGTCFLVAAVPFGSEFQQRTLAGLLAQPVARAEWWSIKMGLPAIALSLHWAVYLLTRFACGLPVHPVPAILLLMVAVVAWASTPWWTFLSRGLLPGLVFSLTVPLVTLIVLAMISDALVTADTTRIGPFTYDEMVFMVLAWIAAPAYAIAAYRLGRQRWMQLEAPDQALGEGGVLSLPLFRGQAISASRRKPPVVQLIAKEFRLQTATLLMGVAALMAGAVNALPLDALRSQTFYLQGGFLMISLATLVLAGATTVAEERRLGTFDGQLLMPVSRGWQWLLKIAVASVPAALMGTLVVMFAPPLAIGFNDVLSRETTVLLLAALFATACLVSSTSSNSLRALLVSLAVSAGFFLVGSLMAAAGHALVNSVWEGAISEYSLSPEQLAELRVQVEAAPPGSLLNSLQRLEYGLEAFPLVSRAALLLPITLALFLARRNFLHPDLRRARLPFQAVLCLLVLIAAQAAPSVVEYRLRRAQQYVGLRYSVLRHMDWERTLSRGERELLQTFRNRISILDRSVVVPDLRRPNAPNHPRFALPLAPLARAILLERCRIPDHIRELLTEEAERDPRGRPDPAEVRGNIPGVVTMPEGEPTEATPQGPPATTFQMSPELMRRYGLMPAAPGPATAASPTNAPATTYQMSPQMLRRYGLSPTPAGPAPAPEPSQPSPQPTP